MQMPETMKKPKPTPAEKATLEIIRAEIRSLDAQIRNIEPIANSAFAVWEKSRRLADKLIMERENLKAQCKP